MLEMEGVKLRFQEEALHSIAKKRSPARRARAASDDHGRDLLDTMYELRRSTAYKKWSSRRRGGWPRRPLYTYSDKGQVREQSAS